MRVDIDPPANPPAVEDEAAWQTLVGNSAPLPHAVLARRGHGSEAWDEAWEEDPEALVRWVVVEYGATYAHVASWQADDEHNAAKPEACFNCCVGQVM